MLNSANATMQLESDPALRGRVMALYMTIVMGGTPIGSPIIGWVGEHLRRRAGPCSCGGLLVILGSCSRVARVRRAGPRAVPRPIGRPKSLTAAGRLSRLSRFGVGVRPG